MSALAFKPVDETARIEPTFEAILVLVAEQYGLSKAAIRCAEGDAASGARDLFVWLADQLKTESQAVIASFVGMPMADVWAAIHSVDRQRQVDPALRERTDELALVLQVESGVSHQLGRRREDVGTGQSIARRALSSAQAASRVSIREIEVMAATILSTEDVVILADAREQEHAAECQRLVDRIASMETTILALRRHIEPQVNTLLHDWMLTAIGVESASAAHERSARAAHEKNSAALLQALETRFNHKRRFK